MAADQDSSPEGSENLPKISPSHRGYGINRRRFLQTAGTLAGLGITAYAAFNLRIRGMLNIARLPRFDHKAPTGRLSEREITSMLALLELLVPVTLWPSREAMVAMLHKATEQQHGVLKEYQAGLGLLDRSAQARGLGTGFAEAGSEERHGILESLLWKYDGGTQGGFVFYTAKLHRGLEWLFQSESQRRFRVLVARDLLRRFYAEHVAWGMAGYSRSPGTPGDPREYARPASLASQSRGASER